MKYLNDEEVKLLNEMKDRCLNGGQYKDGNAKKKFNMLCHLEDFAVQYYNLQEVIKEAREYIKKHIQKCDIDGAIGNFDEFEILASPKTLLEILSKGENK